MRLLHALLLALALMASHPALAAIDLHALWDFEHPEESEKRFRHALETARGDDVLILQTQIARTYGLRGDFATARAILATIQPDVQHAGPEARVRYELEYGRTLASAAHPRETQTVQAKDEARAHYQEAAALARAHHLDALAIDAIHMMAFVDTDAESQLRWDREALALSLKSKQPDARRWEASLRNNAGYALHELGRYDEALVEFRKALALREKEHDADATNEARWMVAWTLRALGRNDEALAIQERLEKDLAAAGKPDADNYAELELLYRAKGDSARADAVAEKRKALPPAQ